MLNVQQEGEPVSFSQRTRLAGVWLVLYDMDKMLYPDNNLYPGVSLSGRTD